MKKQERLLRAKLQLQQAEDGSNESGSNEEGDDGLWGSKKREYYGEDDEVPSEYLVLVDVLKHWDHRPPRKDPARHVIISHSIACMALE